VKGGTRKRSERLVKDYGPEISQMRSPRVPETYFLEGSGVQGLWKGSCKTVE
jgi:hypothetical protein